MGRQKNGQPKWTPKSAQGICEKHSFFRLILLFLLFGIHLVAAPGAPFMCKIIKKALRLQIFRETKGDRLEAPGWEDKKMTT